MALDPIPDDVLAACAAGELAPAEAEAVRARAAADRVLAARLAAAERLERALRADDLLPVPLALLSSVIRRVRLESARPSEDARPLARARTPMAVRRIGPVAATLLVSLGLWATASGFEPASALGFSETPAVSALSERWGGGHLLRPPTFDVADAWAGLAPSPASDPGPSVVWIASLWIAGGIALLATAGVLARRFRPLFDAATSTPTAA